MTAAMTRLDEITSRALRGGHCEHFGDRECPSCVENDRLWLVERIGEVADALRACRDEIERAWLIECQWCGSATSAVCADWCTAAEAHYEAHVALGGLGLAHRTNAVPVRQICHPGQCVECGELDEQDGDRRAGEFRCLGCTGEPQTSKRKSKNEP